MTMETEGKQLQTNGEAFRLTWSTWRRLNAENVNVVPRRPGVYRVRMKGGTPVQRLVGRSEVLYIGSSGTSPNRNLRVRLLDLVCLRAHVAWPRLKRIRRELGIDLEFCFAEAENPVSAETMLLRQYETEHYELPPVNRVGGLDSREESSAYAYGERL